MNRPLYIFGTAGFAAETALIALSTERFTIAAFIEADSAWMPDRTAMELRPGMWIPILQETEFKDSLGGCGERSCGAIAIANPAIARKIAERFDGLMEWPSVVHPTALTEAAESIGKGNIVYPGTIISWRARVGNFNKFQAYVTVGHECNIGNFNELNPRATISGRVTIGDDTLIGAGAMVRQGLEIGSGAIVGMGAVVVKNVEPQTTVVGNPAKPIGK